MVTMSLPLFSGREATCSAATTLAPVLMPTRMPALDNPIAADHSGSIVLDIEERPVVAEYFQRCFGVDLKDSAGKVQLA